MPRPRKPAHISLTAAKAEKLYGVPQALYQDVCGVPGYDPFRDVSPTTHFFDAETAQLRLDFFPECLRHVKGPLGGKPFELAPWQRAVIVNLFGWQRHHPEGDRRRYRKCFAYVAKKNGKTTFAAGLGLAFLFLDDEAGAEVYSAGESKDQAAYAWSQAAQMVLAEEALSTRARVYGARGGSVQRAIHYEERNSAYKIIASDSDSQDGFNPHAAIVDEIHRFGSGEFIDLVSRSQVGRPNGMSIYITTADYERVSPCNELHEYAVKVRDGVIVDPKFLPVLFEASPDDDWRARATWEKANPSLGLSIPWEACQDLIRDAEAKPAELGKLKRLNLNIVTKQVTQAFDLEKWDASAGPLEATAMREALKGRECFAGLDLATRRDLTALALLFPTRSDDEDGSVSFDVLPYFWIPKENAAQREKDDRVPYLLWAEQGFIELTEGNRIDYRVVRQRVNELGREYRIREIGMDSWNATQIETELGEEDGFTIVEVPQAMKALSSASKELDALVPAGLIRHGRHPVLRWCVSNASIKRDHNENMKYVKGPAEAKRIDGVVATVMALARFMVSTPPAVPSWTIFTGEEEGEDDA